MSVVSLWIIYRKILFDSLSLSKLKPNIGIIQLRLWEVISFDLTAQSLYWYLVLHCIWQDGNGHIIIVPSTSSILPTVQKFWAGSLIRTRTSTANWWTIQSLRCWLHSMFSHTACASLLLIALNWFWCASLVSREMLWFQAWRVIMSVSFIQRAPILVCWFLRNRYVYLYNMHT
jgi:hypothetical protein